MQLEQYLRLLLAGRRVAWLATDLPAYCVRASHHCWQNEFFPRNDDPSWSRVVVFSQEQVPDAIGLVAAGGCIVVIGQPGAEVRMPKGRDLAVEYVETADGHGLALIERPVTEKVAIESARPGSGGAREASRWAKQAGRLAFAARHFGLGRRLEAARFLADLKALDQEMGAHGAHYLSQVEDPAGPIDPSLHYLLEGAAQRLSPRPDFSTRHYLAANPDVAQAGVNPLLHYVRNGREEGRLAMPAAPANATGSVPMVASSRVAALSRRSPIEELWVASHVSAQIACDWAEVRRHGPCSLVLIASSATASARWLNAFHGAPPVPDLDLVVVSAGDLGEVPDPWRPVVCHDPESTLALGVAAARSAMLILCSDVLVPAPGALGALVGQARGAGSPVSAKVLSQSGVVLDVPADGRSVRERVPAGDALAPRWFCRRSTEWSWPACLAGTAGQLKQLVGDLSRGVQPALEFAPNALVFVEEDGQAANPTPDGPVRTPPARTLAARKKIIQVGMQDWSATLAGGTDELRLFLLDLAQVWDAVRISTRVGAIPLSDVEWLGAACIECVDSAPSSRADGTAAAAIWIGSGQPFGADTAGHGPRVHRVQLEALKRTYGNCSYLRTAGDGFAHNVPSVLRVLCNCTYAGAARAGASVLQAHIPQADQAAEVLFVGPHAKEACDLPLPQRWRVRTAPTEQDWVRHSRWADWALVASPLVSGRPDEAAPVMVVNCSDLAKPAGANSRLADLIGLAGRIDDADDSE